MRQEILARLISGLDFVTLKEVAARCLEFRGYELAADSDGWSDGGSDLRLYIRGSAEPAKYAIQTSVDKNWKAKVRADAIKAKRQLHCLSYMYVSSRRIPDADFIPIADELEMGNGIRATKMDQQDLAGFLLNNDLLSWFMELLGVTTTETADAPTSPAEEARDAYMLFSEDAMRFRETMVQHALELALARSNEPIARDQLAVRALTTLGTTGKAMAELARATIDRLIQSGRIASSPLGLSVAENVRADYLQARQLVMEQWRRFIRDLSATMRPFLPRGAAIGPAVKRMTDVLGMLVLKYREYQAVLLSDASIAKRTRQKYTAAIESTRAVLAEIGVSAEKMSQCLQGVIELHQKYPLLERLSAGEVFRNLLERTPSSLFQVLGGQGKLSLVYDTPIAIPMICARLYEVVEDRYTLASVRCSEIASEIGADQLLPDLYLQECASHLIDAGRYEPIFTQVGAQELHASENAYASYFSRLQDVTYAKFLHSFGYKSEDMEFGTHRDLITMRLQTLFKKYGVQALRLKGRRGDNAIRKQVETALAHVYHDTNEEDRPEILRSHDASVVRAMVEDASESVTAQVLVTWDKTLFEVNRSLSSEWWCMDPASASDLLALGLPGAGATTSVDVLLMIESPTVQLSGKIWDTIVKFEREKLRDADLLEKAREFKENFLRNQTSDKVITAQIIAAWKHWKQ